MAYVMCRVSGGVTGTRQARLKSHGEVRVFPTFSDAEAEARRLTDAVKADRAAGVYGAQYQYWAVEGD
jgi:hypothetical protein